MIYKNKLKHVTKKIKKKYNMLILFYSAWKLDGWY